MGIGKTLDRVFADPPDIGELIGHPVRIWRRRPTHEKVAVGLTFVLCALIVTTGVIFVGGLL